MTPPLTTPVAVPPLPFKLDFSNGIVSLGSCFSDEVGHRLAAGGFRIDSNPFGTLYNPASMAEALRRILDDREVGPADLVEYEGLFHSWHHHGSFSRATPEATLDACNSRLHQAHAALAEASLLVLTFGTAWVFELADGDGRVVANCHKLPSRCFRRRRLTPAEIVALWQPLLQRVATCCPRLEVLFSVSPIRHLADGLHGNQLSKASLLLAVDELTSQPSARPRRSYFPAYELVVDELRDYRFFAPDMVHPSPLAVDFVWDRFQQACMSPAVRQQVHNNAKQALRAAHRPLHVQ